jgi:transposase
MTRRRGLKGSRRGRQLEVIVLRSEGLSLRQIAQRLGCSVGTVHNDLRDAAQVFNLPVQKRPRSDPEMNTELNTAKVIPLRRRGA